MLSVLIVTFNSERHIAACLASLPWKTMAPLLDVWIVDNRSTDQTRERIEAFSRQFRRREIRTIWNTANLGYAAAVNQALSACRGEWICLLGPDTRVQPGSFEIIVDFLKLHPRSGAASPRLVDPNGNTQSSCRRFPTVWDVLFEMTGLPRLFPKRFQPRWKMPDFRHDSIRRVDQPEATCLMVRRRAFEDVGFMDERFPLFFNDVDWCRRFRLAGWDVVFLPEAVVEHARGASVRQDLVLKIWKSHQGFYRYFRKYGLSFSEKASNLWIGLLLIITAVFRSMLSLTKISIPAQTTETHDNLQRWTI
jgi:GT2 family glycosyltransferase